MINEQLDDFWKGIALDWYGSLEPETEKMAKFFAQYTPQLLELIKGEKIKELELLGGNTIHPEFCKKRGEQFIPCLQCLKEHRIKELKGSNK